MKVNIGSVGGSKKSLHRIPRSITTTSHTGFCQPICVRELCAQDHLRVRTANKVYFQPMVKPTFGRLFLRNYKSFVPIEELWHAYPSFLAGKSYSGAIAQYIPTMFPSMPIGALVLLSYMCSEVSVFTSADPIEQFSTGINIADPSIIISAATAKTYFEDVIDEYSDSLGIDLSNAFEVATNYGLISYNLDSSTVTQSNFMGRYDWFMLNSEGSALVCGRLTERGKNLRKIIIGSGYQFSLIADYVEILSIFAYYKAWYDLFAIQRESTWKDTNAFACLEYLEQSGLPLHNIFLGQNEPFCTRFFDWWFLDLPQCYYTQSPDFAAAHIPGTAVTQVGSSFGFLNEDGDLYQVNSASDSQPIYTGGDNITQNGLNVLKKMYERINTLTAVGGRIRDIMRSIFGAEYAQENESNYIGSTEAIMDISQVTSTAETEQGYLGEYAGRGVGEDPSHEFDFTASRQGYFVEFFCIVPDSRLAQGIDPLKRHIDRYDFFDQKFDSVTLLPTAKSSIYATNDFARLSDLDNLSTGFGNIPNYMEYKVSQDCVNGDVSMASTRGNLLPFSFAKLLPYTSVSFDESTDEYVIRNVNPNIITCGDLWRYIGLDKWLGNYDRVFVNSGSPYGGRSQTAQSLVLNDLEYRLDDNFVCYFYQDMSYTGYARAVADSFETDPFGNHDSVRKA